MPELTPKLGIKKPLGNETVSRVAFNENWDIIDQNTVADKGGVPSIQAGLDANKPAAGTAGRLYVATDTQIIYRDTGTTWTKVGVVKWGDIDGKPSTFPPSTHTHPGSNITSKVDSAAAADVVPWTGVSGKPSTFPPSAHKSTHATGGNDELTPADIGAETPAGAQGKVDAHANATAVHRATSAAIANRIMMRDRAGRAKVAAPAAANDIARKDTVDAVQTNLNNHTGNTSNPHNVTAAQLGASNILAQIKTVDGAGSGLDADLVRGRNLAAEHDAHLAETIDAHGGIVPSSDVVTTAIANKILKLNNNAKLPASITGDADTVDGYHASNFGKIAYGYLNGRFDDNVTITTGWQPRFVCLFNYSNNLVEVAVSESSFFAGFGLYNDTDFTHGTLGIDGDSIGNIITLGNMGRHDPKITLNSNGFQIYNQANGVWVAIG